ncbi:MAG TPA: ABC transporter permease [Bryobacteraceae bacterium]|nr:ABC transporter permease [Bryobacteraceae bacterium]
MSWTRVFRRRYWDRERSREIQAYLEIETDENIARGMSPEEARCAARRKLGNPVQIREEIYSMNSLGFAETLWQDLRFGARLLRLNPGFAVVAVASLALGIGANTAIFQLLDAVRLRTLPVKNPQELVEVRIANRQWFSGKFNGSHPEMTNPLWEQIRDHQQAFSGILAWSDSTFNLGHGGEARLARALWVSGDFFNVLGVHPLLGRLLTTADDRRGCASPGAVISYSFWQREFAGDPSAIGKKLTLDGYPFAVIGVSPATFFGVEVGQNFDVAVPLCSEAIIKGARLDKRNSWWLVVMGRLKPGWSLGQAAAYFRARSTGLLEATMPPEYDAEQVKRYLAYRLSAFPAGNGRSALRENYADPLWLLLAVAGLVLLIACVNVANLLLARASVREREIGIRLSIGASRGRLVRQLLAESLLLAGLGAFLGALLARSLSRSLVAFLSTQGNALFLDLNPDGRVLVFMASLAAFTCMLFGLMPALRATRTAPGEALKAGGRSLTAAREGFGLRRVLVVSQLSISCMLLVAALLFVRSFRNLVTLDAGFRQDGILITYLDLRQLHLAQDRLLTFRSDLLDRLRTIPAVDSAADATIIPASGDGWGSAVWMGQQKHDVSLAQITPGYFKTMGTAFRAGRDFDQHDTITSPKVAIVNQAFARQFLGGADPIGRTFRKEGVLGQHIFEIVGLVSDTKYYDLREPFEPIVFLPESQDDNPRELASILIRSNAPLAGLTSALKRAIRECNPAIAFDFRVFKTKIRESLLRDQLMATLSGFFAFLAALLAVIGLYGVMSYMVARRRNEIGIRMALGADRRDVLRMILREAGTLLLIGLGLGLALALAAGRPAGWLFFGLPPHDPLTLAMAAGSLAAVALAAGLVPALRASRVNPMTALRNE